MLNHIRTRFLDMKLRSKMVLVYSVFISLFLVLALLTLQGSFNTYDEKLFEKSIQELDFFHQKVNATLNQIDAFSYDIALDATVQESLSAIERLPQGTTEYAFQMYLFRQLLIKELGALPFVVNIRFLDNRGTDFVVGTYSGMLEKDIKTAMLEMFEQKRGGYAYLSPTERYAYFLSGRNILELSGVSLRYLGSLLITSDISAVIRNQREALEAENAMLYVYSPDGVVYRDDTTLFDSLPAPEGNIGYYTFNHEGQKYFVCYLKSSQNGWVYINAFPFSEIFGQTQQLRSLLIIAFSIFFGITLFLMHRVANMITKPLKKLTQTMQLAETGDLSRVRAALVPPFSKDESGTLTKDFRRMIKRIDTLIIENYKKQLIIKDTKYRMLRAQINPHFLYNTLNTISWMVKANLNEDAICMIVELGNVLRAAFDTGANVSVEKELEIAKSYTTIQQFRYQQRAVFRFETEGGLAPYMIPQLIIQPLIENAIVHGIDDSLEPVTVTIGVYEEADRIRIAVRDTGLGMSPERLEAVRAGSCQSHEHGIGLTNIRERLKMTYENSLFTIESEAGKGTAVVIYIPKVRLEAHG